MPFEALNEILEFLLGEEQVLVLSVDRRAAAGSIATRAQIADQFWSLSELRFDELLVATDALIESLLGEELSSALAYERRIAASPLERRAEIAEQQWARATRRFDDLRSVRENATALWLDLESLQS